MALSRLQNFLNNPTGVVLFVDSANFDATDGLENRGTSPVRPFVSLQRACIEASRFSFQVGKNNDLNDRTTILVSPGKHYIDNRPGFSIEDVDGTPVCKRKVGRNNWIESTLSPLGENSNFDVFDPNNDLYKYNSIHGGLILPRGTSIVAQDLRKTKIIPLYVPDPLDEEIERSSIFNVTGSCYFKEFTIFDADSTKFAYKNYSNTKHVPKYSHHKLTAFVYADGVNEVNINSNPTGLTDLDMYYHKITIAYDSISNRGLVDFPENLDFEPNINEFRIVGPLQEIPLGISSIRAGNGDGSGDKNIITVTTVDLQTKILTPHNFTVDTPVVISGITESPDSYNGTFLVREVINENTFTYVSTSIPGNVLPSELSFETATVATESDTVSSSSPYIFSCSLKSTYGMCGLWADGSKSLGFKSMVVAQFTGISLQKDNNAYLIYDKGVIYDNLTLPTNSSLRPLYQNSRAFYKPDFENFHIKASDDAFIQAVSVFAIGYCDQFITKSGGDMSITNSNSNFGATALNSIGFKADAFRRDDVGYITHILPPKEIEPQEISIPWLSLDINKIKVSPDSSKLYISKFNDKNVVPPYQLEGYRIGSRYEDMLYVDDINSSPIVMPSPNGTLVGLIAKKEYKISRSSSINSVSSSGVITLDSTHSLFTGEKVRLYSNTGQMPDGLESDKIYYAISTGVNPNQIKLSNTLSEALSNNHITDIGKDGGVISIVSSVIDKLPGEFGHPIQWDDQENSWYILSSFDFTNKIYDAITSNTYSGTETPVTYIKRVPDNRRIDERIYKIRYVIPKQFISAKPPQVGYVIQETNDVNVSSISVNSNIQLSNSIQLRNDKVIVSATTSSVVEGKQIVTITTELPHNFVPGDIVNVKNIRSSNNPQASNINTRTYNGDYKILNVFSPRTFTYELSGAQIDPGSFTNNINQRATSQQRKNLPLVSRKSYKDNFYIYRVDTIKKHIPGEDGQDGVYHLIILSSSVRFSDELGYNLNNKSFNPDVRNLYPQIDRDNINSNPRSSVSYPDISIVGKVITDDKKNSITSESIDKFNKNTKIGFNVVDVSISGFGNTSITLTTDINHGLNSIRRISFVSAGSGYPVNSTFYSKELIDAFPLQENSTCNYTTNSAGNVEVNTFRLVDVGAGHTVGEVLQIEGGTTPATITISEIIDNVGDTLQLSGFIDTEELNGVYEIVDIPSKKTIVIYVPTGLSTYTSNTNNSQPFGYVSDVGISILNMELSSLVSGIATITTSDSHNLFVGNKLRIVNSNRDYYNNKDFTVRSVIGLDKFTIDVGDAPNTNVITSGRILKYGIAPNILPVGANEENLFASGYSIYSGLTVKLISNLSVSDDEIAIDNHHGLNRGDFLNIGNEILRISAIPNNNVAKVIRGQLGTISSSAVSGAIVRKIKVLPCETRRPSSLRASGQTFEYVGYGPGNYSTALPQRQDRILDEYEVLVSQSKKQDSGSIVYTGMNDLGDFYTGSKKISATTGAETTIEAPIITYAGDDLESDFENKQTGKFDEILVRDKLIVEGGKDGRQNSQFYGPVLFNTRLTNLSKDGILVSNLYLRGQTNISDKLIGVGLTTSELGAISFISNPTNLNHIGSVRVGSATTSEWRPFGPISLEKDKLNFVFDKVGVGASAGANSLNVVGTARIQNLEVYGSLSLPGEINLNLESVQYEDIVVSRTARFAGIGTSYTQMHQSGISKLFDLEVVGVSTFVNDVYVQKGPDVGSITPTLYADRLEVNNNVQVGVANSNTISTKFGNLIFTPQLNSSSIFNSDVLINKNLSVSTNLTSGGIATAIIEGGNTLKLGIGHTNRSSFIDLNNDTRQNTFGLRIIRDSGPGDVSSRIIHSGTSPMEITATNSAEIRVLTNNIRRLAISTTGSIISYQNNSGLGITDCNLRLTQNGSGNASLFWDITRNNANIRWYSGIDVNDEFSWKLATPLPTTPYGNENYANDAKLKVDVDGNLFIYPGGLSVCGVSSFCDIKVNNVTASGVSTFIGPITGTISRADTIRRVGITTSNGLAYRVLLGDNTDTSNYSSTYVVTDATRLTYNPFTNILNATARDLNRRVIAGVGLVARDGIDDLNGQNITLDVDDTVVVKTTGTQTIDGVKTFSRTIVGSITQINTNSVAGVASTTNNFLTFVDRDSSSNTSKTLNTHSGIYYNPGPSDLFVRGKITAFAGSASDDRLKENKVPIINALDKVNSLTGFTYTWNKKASDLGLSSKESQVGVSAQEVQSVLPEVVSTESLNEENILLVKYEKLVPLLIEAIKEQNIRIDELERKLSEK